MTAFNAGHEIIPEPGTVRRVRGGKPADLTNPAHYPVTATCKTCGQPVRCDRWLRSRWYHTGE